MASEEMSMPQKTWIGCVGTDSDASKCKQKMNGDSDSASCTLSQLGRPVLTVTYLVMRSSAIIKTKPRSQRPAPSSTPVSNKPK